MNDRRRVLFILSVKAGTGRALSLSSMIRSLYREVQREVDIVLTTHSDHAFEAAEAFARTYGADALIVICGGDGSAHEVTNALVGSQAAMGVLPLGTANDFAKMLYTKQEQRHIECLLKRTLTPRFAPIDIIRINERYALNIVSFGFDTFALQHAYRLLARLPFLDKSAYALGVVPALFGPKALPLSIRWMDDEERSHAIDDQMTLGAICNGGYYGNGFHPAPEARLDDGRLRICLARALTVGELIRLTPRYKRGRHEGHPKVIMGNAVTVDVASADGHTPVVANADGLVFSAPRLHLEVVPRALMLAWF